MTREVQARPKGLLRLRRKALTNIARSGGVNLRAAVLLVAMGYADDEGVSEWAVDELATVVSRGRRPVDHELLAKAVRELAEVGVLAPESTTRRLALPERLMPRWAEEDE